MIKFKMNKTGIYTTYVKRLMSKKYQNLKTFSRYKIYKIWTLLKHIILSNNTITFFLVGDNFDIDFDLIVKQFDFQDNSNDLHGTTVYIVLFFNFIKYFYLSIKFYRKQIRIKLLKK